LVGPNNAILKNMGSVTRGNRGDWAGDARVELDVPLRVEVLLIRVALKDVTQLHDSFLRGAELGRDDNEFVRSEPAN
jgi:hypothetical protein